MALILIADDDRIVVEMARFALGSRGHVVGAVDDGMPVLSIVNLKQPALVILDCNMPELSGLETLRRIRLSPVSYATPVLMLTACVGQEDEDVAIHFGADDYLRKPFDSDQLVSRVELLLSKAEERNRKPPLPVYRFTPPAERAWGER